jgi:hypothetical protein
VIDYRLPEHRKAYFLAFYHFHLKYRAHPGCVYYLMPFLAKTYEWTMDQKLWFAFLNGCTQNPVTSLIIFRRFPELPKVLMAGEIHEWFNRHWTLLPFDTDRRYQKRDFPASVLRYAGLAPLFGSQDELMMGTFENLWKRVREHYYSFGRLAAFSYLEYVKIMGAGAPCDTLFLNDMEGSKSHRNGLCKLLGRDDLDWHKSNPDFPGYTPEMIECLTEKADRLLKECQEKWKHEDFVGDVGYFTLESILCTFKSSFRPNRRYPGCYNDMLHDRIKQAESLWPEEDLSVFWKARQAYLPKELRVEDCPDDPGLSRPKQNHFRLTGQVPMLGYLHPEFEDDGSWRRRS